MKRDNEDRGGEQYVHGVLHQLFRVFGRYSIFV